MELNTVILISWSVILLLSIIKGFKKLVKSWKVKQLNKIIHADKRKNGRAKH